MRETGYVMNSAARALATNRTKTIGAVVPTLAYSIFARFLNAVERKLADHSYALVIATPDDNPKVEEKRTRELLDMGAEGIILSGAIHDRTLLQLLENRRIPAVCTSVCKTRNGLPAIGYDNALIGQMAISYLADLGHRSVGVIHGPLVDNDRTRLRVSGITRSARRRDVRVDLQETVLEVAGGVEAAAGLFAMPNRPTAILCLSDILLGTLFEAGRAGFAVPADISVMGCDDLDWAAHCRPRVWAGWWPFRSSSDSTARPISGTAPSRPRSWSAPPPDEFEGGQAAPLTTISSASALALRMALAAWYCGLR